MSLHRPWPLCSMFPGPRWVFSLCQSDEQHDAVTTRYDQAAFIMTKPRSLWPSCVRSCQTSSVNNVFTSPPLARSRFWTASDGEWNAPPASLLPSRCHLPARLPRPCAAASSATAPPSALHCPAPLTSSGTSRRAPSVLAAPLTGACSRPQPCRSSDSPPCTGPRSCNATGGSQRRLHERPNSQIRQFFFSLK